ncbi:MAG: hypothetical protein ABFD89_25965 [Bryobacteraceae bacterium]
MPQVPTQYGDHRFHSRLAARWAVFLDILGIPFEYRQVTYKLEGMNDRLWCPDFYLPTVQRYGGYRKEEEHGSFLMALETKPNDSDLECAAQIWPDQEVYLFSGAVNENGISCYRMEEMTVYSVLFAQCPFCGYAFVGSVRDEGKRTWNNHSCPVAECEFAAKFDIDSAFMDFVPDNLIPPPTDSPMLQIAKCAANSVRFESATSLSEVDGMRRSVQLLRENKQFASPALMEVITRHATSLSLDKRCPRYVEPWYVTHEKHQASGSQEPCPCSDCRRQKSEVTITDLEKMKAPERRM